MTPSSGDKTLWVGSFQSPEYQAIPFEDTRCKSSSNFELRKIETEFAKSFKPALIKQSYVCEVVKDTFCEAVQWFATIIPNFEQPPPRDHTGVFQSDPCPQKRLP